MSARDGIENLWDRATPVGPLLDAHRADVLAEAADLLAELGTPIYGARSEHERGLMYGAERLRTLARMAADPVKADRMQDTVDTLATQSGPAQPKPDPTAEVDRWNTLYPVATPVFAYPGCRPEDDPNCTQIVTHTRSEAFVNGGHTAAVWVAGYSAYIALTHVDPRPETGGAS
ncbi:hypothetical protein ACFWAF_02740 [Streptomyces microflavus]|uniref:hypothetical protein n=1 Tax=Streptomyces microflavus TaxID=1919 RepID=UPI00364B502C